MTRASENSHSKLPNEPLCEIAFLLARAFLHQHRIKKSICRDLSHSDKKDHLKLSLEQLDSCYNQRDESKEG